MEPQTRGEGARASGTPLVAFADGISVRRRADGSTSGAPAMGHNGALILED